MNKVDRAKGFKSLVRKIERSNKTFEKATPAQKIVLVAKDVLSLLDLKRIEAEHSVYVRIQVPNDPSCHPDSPYHIVGGKQVSDILKMPELSTCQVCAIGGAMLAATIRLNDVVDDGNRYCGVLSADYDESGHSSDTDDGMSENANSVFDPILLRLMETAFEGAAFGYRRLTSADGRLRAIYQNLIDNRGHQFTRYHSKSLVWSPETGDATGCMGAW